MADFECHITMKGDRFFLERIVKTLKHGWSFSCIDGDPVLGYGVFCYATNHFPSLRDAKFEVGQALMILEDEGIKPTRAKIEHVIWDKRFDRA